jgi:hypothetical protein
MTSDFTTGERGSDSQNIDLSVWGPVAEGKSPTSGKTGPEMGHPAPSGAGTMQESR